MTMNNRILKEKIVAMQGFIRDRVPLRVSDSDAAEMIKRVLIPALWYRGFARLKASFFLGRKFPGHSMRSDFAPSLNFGLDYRFTF